MVLLSRERLGLCQRGTNPIERKGSGFRSLPGFLSRRLEISFFWGDRPLSFRLLLVCLFLSPFPRPLYSHCVLGLEAET